MIAIGLLFVRMLCDCFRSRRRLEAEILVLRHQLNVASQIRTAFASMASNTGASRTDVKNPSSLTRDLNGTAAFARRCAG
jgi:hypothetical protein